MKNIWIIGASSGIGFELLKLFLKDGFNVVASSRTAQKSKYLLDLKQNHQNLRIYDIDVSDINSIQNCMSKVFNHLKKIDLVFFNAGVYEMMKVNEWKIDNYEQMVNINYLGAVRLIDSLKSYFFKQGFGRCVFNASLSSYFGLPYGGAYSASKSALVNFAQSIQPELLKYNIQIQIINHGFVKTRLTSKNNFEMPQLMNAKFAANEIFKQLFKPYRFEIAFPFKLSFFLKLLACIPFKYSLSFTKRFL